MMRPGPHGRAAVTSRDVARAADVSQALVSRAFSGNGRIAEDTRERIFRVAAEIGWQPNALAASMVTGDAPLVAVITTRLSFDWRAQVLSRLLKAFEDRNLKPIIFYAERDEEVDRLLAETISWRTRGVVVTAGTVRPERAEAILSRGQFLAALNRPANHPRRPMPSPPTTRVAGARPPRHCSPRDASARSGCRTSIPTGWST